MNAYFKISPSSQMNYNPHDENLFWGISFILSLQEKENVKIKDNSIYM